VIYVAIKVKKKENETTRGLLRRFFRVIQQSGVLIQARRVRFREKGKSRRERKESALRRNKIVLEREKLKKMGLLEEEEKWRRR
jgi:ribosomal protein S21